MKEFLVTKAKNGYVVRTNEGIFICASIAQVKKLVTQFFEPVETDPPF